MYNKVFIKDNLEKICKLLTNLILLIKIINFLKECKVIKRFLYAEMEVVFQYLERISHDIFINLVDNMNVKRLKKLIL